MPGWSPVVLCYIYRDLVGIIVKAKCGSLGILVHGLRKKIPIVGNQGESEVGSADGFDWIEDQDMQTHPDQCETVDYIP